ncbi:MAG: hypothetical protein ACLFQQ_22060, partial [Desulfococcaceae bacterium]
SLRRAVNQRQPRPPRSKRNRDRRGPPLHIGRSTQVWGIRIADEDGPLVCASRLTMAVIGTSGDLALPRFRKPALPFRRHPPSR